MRGIVTTGVINRMNRARSSHAKYDGVPLPTPIRENIACSRACIAERLRETGTKGIGAFLGGTGTWNPMKMPAGYLPPCRHSVETTYTARPPVCSRECNSDQTNFRRHRPLATRNTRTARTGEPTGRTVSRLSDLSFDLHPNRDDSVKSQTMPWPSTAEQRGAEAWCMPACSTCFRLCVRVRISSRRVAAD